MADYESKVKITVDDSELDSAKRKIDDLKDKKVKTKIDVDDSAVGKAGEGLKKVGQSASGAGKSVDGLGKSMGLVSKNTILASASYKAFNASIKGIEEMVAQVKELNDSLTTVAMTMQNISGGDLSNLKSQILDMSNELSSYVKNVADAVEIYANANESVSTIMQKAQPTVLLSTAAKMSASDAADTVQGILSQFKLADDAAMGVVDTLEGLSSEMRMDFSKGIQSVSEAIKVSGSVIDEAGMSFERYASIVSATAEATRSSGSVLGNAFKTISSRISRSKDGETTSTERANSEAALNSIGINLRKADGDFQDLSVTLDSLSKVWDTLTRSQKSYVSEQIAGVRQKSVFIAMMDNYNRALQLEQKALGSSGKAMEINETRAESIDGKLQKLSATMSKMYNNAVSEDAIKSLLDFANGAANVADKLGLLEGAFTSLGVAGLATGVGLLYSNWSKLVAVMTSPTAGIAIGAGALVSVYSALKQKQEELIQTTKEESTVWSDSNTTIDEQINKYKELKSQLDSGTLSSSEEYETKKQILDIQNQLVSSYGSQANGIDLINGSLEKELALMNELSVANANSYLNENAEGIAKATDEMTKERYYSFGSIANSKDNKSLISDLQDIAKEIDGIDLNSNEGNMFVEFHGDAVKAKDSIDEYMTKVRQLKSEMEANGQDTSALDTLLQQGSGELAKNQKILDDFQSTYNTALQSDMISKGFGSDKPATIYKSYAEAVQEYNDALLSGDDSKIASAKTKFDEVQSSVDGVVEKYPEYTSLFDEVGSALDTASVKANDFKNALKMDDMSDVLNALKNVKDIDLKSMNFDDNVTSDSENALAKIVDKAIELGIVSDDSSESIAEVVDILVQLGYVSGDTSGGVDKVTQSMSDLTEKTQGVVNDIRAVMDVLSGQKTGESISLADFNSDELKDYKSALEYVNGSMQLNVEKVQEITKAKADETIAINESNKALKQAEYLKNAGEIERLRSKLKELTEGTQDYNDVELQLQSLMSSNEAISDECAQYDLLTATIKEATSAYSNWLSAQSGSDYGDMFNDSLDAYARIMDTYNYKSDIYGDFGSKKFDAAVDFIVPDTVDSEDTDAIKKYMDSFKQYLTFDDDGNATGMNIERFCKNAVDKGLMVLDESGENYQIAGQTTMEDFAKGLNMSSGMVQAFFDQLQLKGGEFSWDDEAIKTVGDLGVKAYESAEALRSLDGYSDLEIKMDVSGIDNLDDKLSTLDGTIQQMNDLKAQPDVDPSQIEYANDIIQYCVAQKQKLSEPVFMTIDTSQVDGELGEVISLIQQLQIAKNELDIQASVGADTTEAQGKVDSLVSQIQSKDATIKATIGDVDTSNVDTILAGVSAKSAEMWVNIGVNENAVTGYVPENKTATVTYTLDSYAVDTYNPKNLRRTVTYTVVTNGNPPIVNGTAHVEGTAHLSGTVRSNPRIGKALASGEWGVNKNETALVGELGQELVVYGNKWFTVGDNGAEFTSIPKGAIVFNHKQTEEIFKNGYVTSGGGRGHAYASGTAYVGGGIPVSNAKMGSYSYNSSKKKKTTNNSSSSDKDFEEVKDWVKIYLEEQSRITDRLVNAIDDMVGLSAKQAATDKAISQVQAEIVANQKAYNTYKQKADSVELSQSYKNQVINGTLNIETITDEELKNTIEDFEKWHDEMVACEDKIEDLKDKLKDLAQTKFDNVTTEFKNQISLIEHEIKSIELSIDEIENRGYLVSTKFYNDMIKNETDNLNHLKNEYATLTSTLQSLLDSGMVERYSDQWFEMMSDINDVSESIQEANNSLIEYQNNIRDLNWEVFDKLQEKISTITSESEFLIKLLSDGKLFDSENGKITKQGQAVLGLNVLNYNTLMAQADEYAKELAEIGKQLELDPNNLDLAERYNDLLEKQQDAILDANSAFEDAISIVEDGFDVFLDSMDKLISKRKDELSAIKDLHDYEKNIAEQTKEIASLEKQLKAFQGDTSESTKATIQQIKVSLEEAKMNLEETEYDRYIKDQEELFDKLKDDTEEWMNQRMDDRDWLLQQLIDYTNENADIINEAINSSAESVGYDISDAMNAIWSPGGTYSSVVAGYVDNFSSQLTTTNNVLNDIRSYMAKLVGESDKKAEEITNETKPIETPTTPTPTPTPTPPTNTNNGSGDGVPSVGDAVTFASGKYYYSSDGISPYGSQMLGQTVYISKINNKSWATKPYHITKNKDGSSPLGWVSLDQLTGYKTGGLVDETGLAMLHGSKEKPELVLNAKDTENFMELTDTLRDIKGVNLEDLIDLDTEPEIIKQLKANLPNLVEYDHNFIDPLSYNNIRDIKPRDVSTNVKIEIGDIQMYGVNDPKQFAVQLKDTLLNDNSVKKIIQSDTLGLALGKNSLSKFKYR